MDTKRKRCPKGTRRNKKSGECETNKVVPNKAEPTKVNEKEMREDTLLIKEQDFKEDVPEKYVREDAIQEKNQIKQMRCPKGTRRNKKTGNCESIKDKDAVKEKEVKSKTVKATTVKATTVKAKTVKEVEKEVIKTPSIVKKNLAANKLQMFMNRTKHKRTALFLKTICSDSGVCIAFGKESDKIKKFFNGFTDFSYMTSKKKIGNDSANGFVYELSYSHQGYNAHTILKSSRTSNADNLMYEYVVGQMVNNFNKKSPSFLETYGVFQYKNEIEWNDIKNNYYPSENLESSIIKMESAGLKESCIKPKHICIMVQHIKKSKTLNDHMSSNYFLQHHLLFVLYQLYFTLSVFSKQFTHYDLHLDNVMLFEPVADKYIEYHYHIPGNTLIFKSSYIAKIIDYGRSYVKNVSERYYEKLCQTKECEPSCGRNVGYGWFTPPSKAHAYISSGRNNISHDLRLLNSCKTSGVKNNCLDLYNLTKKIVYETHYGTPELIDSGVSKNEIHNVKDAELELRRLVKHAKYIALNNHIYTGTEKLGELHITPHQDMVFIPAK